MTTLTRKRPPEFPPPGQIKESHFLSAENESYSFMVEKVDKEMYEFSIFLIDDDEKRTEYVLHCSRESLEWLKNELQYNLDIADRRK